MMTKLEQALGALFYNKLPSLSGHVRSIFVKVIPWVVIFFGIIGLLGMVSLLGIFSATSALTVGVTGVLAMHHLAVYDLILIYLLAPITSVLAILAGYWMLSRKLRGWRLALIATLLGVAIHILHISIFGIVLDCLFIYLLFQIRASYTH